MTDLEDPFANADKVPSISFKNAPVGTVYEGTVTEAPKLIQSRNFDTGEPDFWPAKAGETPQPKMSVVIRLRLDSGEERSLWAQKPSSMFAAIAQARKDAGKGLEVGGRLAVKFDHETPHTDPEKIRKGYAPIKEYVAKYTPPAAPDPFSTPTETPAAAAATGWDGAPF
jgi:hypothetical protein